MFVENLGHLWPRLHAAISASVFGLWLGIVEDSFIKMSRASRKRSLGSLSRQPSIPSAINVENGVLAVKGHTEIHNASVEETQNQATVFAAQAVHWLVKLRFGG